MTKSWNEMKVKQLILIREVNKLQNKTDDEKNLMVAAILGGIEYNDILQMPLADTAELVNNAMFLMEKPEPVKARKSYTINGKEYTLLKNSVEMTVAQYIDFQALVPDGFENHIAEMLAIFLVPKGHNYNDGYDKDEVLEDILEMSVVEALGVADFFTNKCIKLMEQALMYSELRMKIARLTARKADREMLKAMELQMKLIKEELHSIYGSLL